MGKTTRPFSYDLNPIPYDYTVEVMNRFKRLDLVDRVPEELWTEVGNIVQEAVTKTIPRKNSTHGHHHMGNTKIRLIMFFAAKNGEALYSQKKKEKKSKKPGVDCGSDHELLIAKFSFKLKEVVEVTMPFRYHLNQIPLIIHRR